MKDLLDLIITISQLSILVPIVVWILSVRKASTSLKLILAGTVLSGVTEIVLTILAYVFENNILVLNISTIPILILFFLAYYLHKDFTPPIRRAIGITGLAGLLFMTTTLFGKNVHQFLNSTFVAMSITYILFALIYFYHKVNFTTHFEVWKHPFFYISAALILLYFSSVAIVATYTIIDDVTFQYLWMLKCGIHVLYNFILAYSFFIFGKYRLSL